MKIENKFVEGNSNKGRRNQNEDNFKYFKNDYDFLICIVADGMGGHIGGRVASAIAVQSTIDFFQKINFNSPILQTQENLNSCFIQGVKFIQNALKKASVVNESLIDMGTTVNINFFIGDNLYTLNIGDSRASIFSNGELTSISKDQNYSSMTDRNLTKEQALKYSHYLMSALGPDKETKLDIFKTKLSNKGSIMITSDGVHGTLESNEIEKILNSKKPTLTKVNDIISLSYNKGSTDNMTCILVEYEI